MKCTAAREALLKPLQAVIGVVERRQTMPILANVLLVAKDGKLTVTATDLEVELVANAEVEIDGPGEVTVPGRKLLDICRALPDKAGLAIALSGEKLGIKSGRSRFTLTTLTAADFPTIEDINAGQTVGVLNAGTEMRIALGLPESVITSVAEGMEVGLTFTAIPGTDFTGRVIEVSPSSDANTSTYPVSVVVQGASDQIRSGMAANVTFDLGEGDISGSVTMVPANAVGEDALGRFVFVLEVSDGSAARVRKQHVTIGRLTAEGFEVLEGLTAGERIATAGLQMLLDGQEVRLQSAS